MKFQALDLPGAWRLRWLRHADERGDFLRLYCREAFGEQGLVTDFPQTSLSVNRVAGTLRGLHYQASPNAETKLVSCISGRVFDVIVDIRPDSATFGHWHGEELRAGDGVSLYVPAGFAHGFLTLEDGSEVLYQISVPYHPDSARGLAWDDPDIGIRWPRSVVVVSARDAAHPGLAALREEGQ